MCNCKPPELKVETLEDTLSGGIIIIYYITTCKKCGMVVNRTWKRK